MGVPKFASWLTQKYPDMVQDSCPDNVHGLYVDLNGLIHPCCHDEDDPTVAQRPEPEKLRQICLAVETLVVTTRPRSVVYIAIDGVAPRAKMNQQRSRRYMSAAVSMGTVESVVTEAAATPTSGSVAVASIEKEFTEEERANAEGEIDALQEALAADPLYGGAPTALDAAASTPLLPAVDALLDDFAKAKPAPASTAAGVALPVAPLLKRDETAFDSNCISPGTDFMEKVSITMRDFVEKKIQQGDAAWAHLTVVFSDSNVPGEGEHKFIDFLRTQSSFAGFNQSMGSHVVAGLDADLIFLTLSLHIPRLVILRDNGRPSSFDKDTMEGPQKGMGQHAKATSASSSDDGEEDTEDQTGEASRTDNVPVAAVHVEKDLSYEYYDIDTVGASLISEVYQLCQTKQFRLHKSAFWSHGELTSSSGYVYDRVAGKAEGERKKKPLSEDPLFHPCTSSCNAKIIDDFIVMAMVVGNDFLPRLPAAFCGESAIDSVLEMYVGDVLPYGFLTLGTHEINLLQLKRFFSSFAKVEAVKFRQHCIQTGSMTAEEAATTLHSAADDRCWRQIYYATTSIGPDKINEACKSYIEGLRFVWRYYSSTSTQVSWSWYYPFHHGPLSVDLAEFLARMGSDVQARLAPPALERDPPDTISQLLCILPPRSKRLVPEIFRHFMSSPPEDLKDTFPREWLVDYTSAYGKEHLAAVMTPFANMSRLRQLVTEFSGHLTPDEARRQKSVNFHIILKKKAPEETKAEGGAAAESTPAVAKGGDNAARRTPPPATISDAANPEPESFAVKGAGVGPLTHREVAWDFQSGITYQLLRETPPEINRPRTYSFTIPIPGLTVLADGSTVRPKIRRYGRNKKKDADAEKNQKNNDKETRKVVAPVSRGPNFGAFLIAVACVTLCVTCLLPRCCTSLGVKLQIVAAFTAALGLASVLGLAAPAPKKGSVIQRNTIRFTFVDWQCALCLSLNFSRNTRCFQCGAPYDPARSWALFSRKNPPTPPLMDPNHSQYLERFGIVA